MGKLGGTFGYDPFDLLCLCTIGQIIKVHGLFDGIEEAIGVKGFKQKAVAGIVFNIQIFNGIMDPAGILGHRKGAVNRSDHLGQAAGLKFRRYQNKIGRRVGQVLHLKIKITNRHPIHKPMVVDNVFKYILIITVGHKNHLQMLIPVGGENAIEDIRQQLTALLDRVQSRGPEKDRGEIILDQPEFFLQKAFVFLFAG